MSPYQHIPTLQDRVLPLLRGATAGFIGTIPMTIFMLAMHRFLPKWQRYALPPEEITDELADRASLEKHMDQQERVGAALGEPVERQLGEGIHGAAASLDARAARPRPGRPAHS